MSNLTLHFNNDELSTTPTTVNLTVDAADSVDLQSLIANNVMSMTIIGNVAANIGTQTNRRYSARLDLQLIDLGDTATETDNTVTITII